MVEWLIVGGLVALAISLCRPHGRRDDLGVISQQWLIAHRIGHADRER
jgi:hypothetical protein